jgi:CheY-specific phosphatase CheX
MLGLPMYPVFDDTPAEASLLAKVHISGEWNATLEVATTPAVAMLIAAEMFSLDPTSIQTADMFDALGEIANMVGGNVKGIINGELDLSLPKVESCDHPTIAIAGATIVRMACPDGPLTVTLSESIEAETTV